MSTKQELEQQLNEAIAVAQRLNGEIKTLRATNTELTTQNKQLREDFDNAAERVRYLAGQVKMLDLQIQSSKKYSDNSRNY